MQSDAAALKQPDQAAEDFRRALQKVTSSVVILATRHEGANFAQTVISTAISTGAVEPPSLLLSLNAQSPMVAAITKGQGFSVNYVADDQHELARSFLEPQHSTGKGFAMSPAWTLTESGLPSLNEAVASFDCTLRKIDPEGTHIIFTGKVRAISTTDKGGLLYRDGLLRRLDGSF